MVGEKNIAVSFRVSPRFKKLLEEAASRENRSQTNMLETLLFSYCQQHDVELNAPTHKNKKAQTK
jgi:predicted transcriptional regulator